MSKYILPNILQYILNDYLDHQDIEVYNKVFNFKFDIKKYIKMVKIFKDNEILLYIDNFFLDNKFIKEEGYYHNGNKSYEKNYKNGKLNGSCIVYNFDGITCTETIYEHGNFTCFLGKIYKKHE
jgi:hypothetical protein